MLPKACLIYGSLTRLAFFDFHKTNMPHKNKAELFKENLMKTPVRIFPHLIG